MNTFDFEPTKTILLASPTELISWKSDKRENGISPAVKVAQQWSDVRNTISAAGGLTVIVKSTEPDKKMELIGSSGFLFNGRFLPAVPPKNTAVSFSSWLDGKGFSIFQYLNYPGEFGGSVDIAFDKTTRTVWYGYGFYSSKSFLPTLCEFFDHCDVRVHPLHLVDDRFKTLSQCLMVTDNGYGIWYPGAFDASSQRAIRKNFGEKLIEVSEDDVLLGICNSINVSDFVIIPDSASTKVFTDLVDNGFSPLRVDFSELMTGITLKQLMIEVLE